VYDAERTAQLFCIIANAWPLPLSAGSRTGAATSASPIPGN
jgi:hypothetical protein